jgi:hypothetical protein
MSKLESPMIMDYWKTIGGTLVEEYYAVKRSPTTSPRRIDAIILPYRETRIANWRDVPLDGEDVIVVQAKAHRLGMYLMGQALFSAEIVKQCFKPKSVKSVALCAKDDALLRPMLESFDGLEVVVIEPPAES